MRILYIAYSCDPYMGSEDSIGWNIPFEMSKYNDVIVITKFEHKETISRYLEENNINNILFYFIDIPKAYKKIYNGYMYSGRLSIWNKRAYLCAKNICKSTKIDIIHQLTPTEFRAVGKYGSIQGTKFVCGPIGGGEYIPKGLLPYARNHKLIETIRRLANGISCFKYRINNSIYNCDYLMVANYETRNLLLNSDRRLNGDCLKLIPEVGISNKQIADEKNKVNRRNNKPLRIIAVGRLVYRKGQSLLLDALDILAQDANYECRIIGGGPDLNELKSRVELSDNLKKHVVVTGRISDEELLKEYNEADVFVLPSIREATGGVVLEALAKGVPVIAQKRFGAVCVMNEDCGWFFDGELQDDFIISLSRIIRECIDNHELLVQKKEKAIKKAMAFTWEKKAATYAGIYNKLV